MKYSTDLCIYRRTSTPHKSRNKIKEMIIEQVKKSQILTVVVNVIRLLDLCV